METKEYRTVDKSEWGPGPWQDEPDKLQWEDKATGLACLIVRGPAGALCGYVGVPQSHPWFGVDYNQCTRESKCEETWCDHRPCVEVHGGLTFADSCRAASADGYERSKQRIASAEQEAQKYPIGDSAEWLRTWRPALATYDGYKAAVDATGICHVTSGEDKVWWFGFDCAHSGDVSPKYAVRYGRLDDYESYRDLDYVKRQVTGLAQQLAAVKA